MAAKTVGNGTGAPESLIFTVPDTGGVAEVARWAFSDSLETPIVKHQPGVAADVRRL